MMAIHGVAGEDLYHALGVANYSCRGNLAFDQEPRPITQQQRSWRLSLRVKDLEGPGCSWELPAWLPQRRIHGACFHARSAYMIAVFERVPTARIAVSPLCYYEGIDHFYALVKVRSTLFSAYSACNCREFYGKPEEALMPDVRISGDWRIGSKLYRGLE
jgi:hypothetical protein